MMWFLQIWPKLNNFLKNTTKIYRKKCLENSKENKIQGDFLFKNGDYKKSIMLYSQCIIRAPCCGKLLYSSFLNFFILFL